MKYTSTWLWCSLFLSLVLAACGSASHGDGGGDSDGDADSDADADADCTDFDGDGAGIGDGCAADDCDDTDPRTVDQCGAGCDQHPTRLGCPCSDGAVAPCYNGPEGTGDNGQCAAGLQHCQGGAWGTCDGQELPGIETCDGNDNDCNGEVDNGVLSACGDCNIDCEAHCIGVGCDEAFDPNDGRSVVQDAQGGLTLGGETSITNFVIWIANSQEGTVSKVDTRTREEVGRYRTGPSGFPDPSRSTVNPHGDVVSVNRTEGSATKILASDCTDQNGDGLQTSGGPDDILAWGEDDCVVWHLEGMPGARGSAVEIRAGLDQGVHEYVWVGAYNTGVIYEIDSEEGEFTGREIDQVTPYGAALGPGGYLWTFGSAFGQTVARIDTTTLEKTEFAIANGEYWYGITVDNLGRVWIGGSVARFDPETETWESPPANVNGGGIAVDGNNNAWVGELGSAWFVDGETLEATAIPGAGGHGWAIDFDGFAWSIEMVGTRAHVVNPETLELEETVNGFVGSYTYSDMTGFQLVNATNPVGVFPHLFEACADHPEATVNWSQITCDVDAPVGTVISFDVKTAATADELEAAPSVHIADVPPEACPIDLAAELEAAGVVTGHVLELTATLQSVTREGRPTLNAMGVMHSCEDVFE